MNKDSALLITGGSGFVGSHLLEYLLSRGFTNISITDRAMTSRTDGVQGFSVDLTDAQATQACFEQCRPEYIVNLASVASVGDSFQKADSMMHSNSALMLSVLTAMQSVVPSARLLQVSSAAVYGLVADDIAQSQDESTPLKPINPYAVSKLTQEFLAQAYARSYNLDVVIVRPFNHTGERQTTAFAIPAFAEQIVQIERGERELLSVGNVDAVRDFTDVKDIVVAYELLLEKGLSGEVYNLGSGRGYSMQQMLDLLIENTTANIRYERKESLVRPLDIPVSIADNRKIRALGWTPTHNIKDTVQRILDWQRKQ